MWSSKPAFCLCSCASSSTSSMCGWRKDCFVDFLLPIFGSSMQEKFPSFLPHCSLDFGTLLLHFAVFWTAKWPRSLLFWFLWNAEKRTVKLAQIDFVFLLSKRLSLWNILQNTMMWRSSAPVSSAAVPADIPTWMWNLSLFFICTYLLLKESNLRAVVLLAENLRDETSCRGPAGRDLLAQELPWTSCRGPAGVSLLPWTWRRKCKNED